MNLWSETRKIKIGYIKNSHLINASGLILPRVGNQCETCNDNKGFTLIVERYTAFPSSDDHFYLQCDNCVEQIGLDYTELVKIEKIAKLNEKLELGKISKEKYDKKIGKYLGR